MYMDYMWIYMDEISFLPYTHLKSIQYSTLGVTICSKLENSNQMSTKKSALQGINVIPFFSRNCFEVQNWNICFTKY